MARAKVTIDVPVAAAINANPGYRGVSVVPMYRIFAAGRIGNLDHQPFLAGEIRQIF